MFAQSKTQSQFQASASPTTSRPLAPSTDSSSATGHTPNPLQREASHSVPHGLASRSCVTCRKRKVKCDKQEPCSNCTKAGCECIFPAPGRAPRRPRPGAKGTSEREAELLKRLRRLEGVVEELSGQVEIEAVKHSPGTDTLKDGDSSTMDSTGSSLQGTKVRFAGMDEGHNSKKEWITKQIKLGEGPRKRAYRAEPSEGGSGRMVIDEGKSRYISHPFWNQITDEVEEIREMLQDQDLDSDSDAPVVPTDAVTDIKHQSFIFGYSSSDVDLKSLHPLPSQIPFYWEKFLENVQPLVKIMHPPTIAKTIKEVQNNLDSLSKSTEAMMFSIYFATITSMNADEVQTNFGLSKSLLLKQYRFAVEQALSRAGLLNTSEIVTVQAFVLFLVCVRRHDDTRFVWTMTGLAIRIAQSLGLHRDGAKFGLPPFDTEMRRRLWWQVCILDTRASEDHGSDPSIMDYSYDTEFPTSCNDEDLDPNMTEPPKSRHGVSEMTFCLIRYEICTLSRNIASPYIPNKDGPGKGQRQAISFEQKEKMIRDSLEMLEEKYLQYCGDAGPLYWVAATIARLITAKMSLILYHPFTQPGKQTSLPQDVRDRLFMASIEIIEYSQILERESSTKQWGWLFATYIQWHAIAYILGELASRDNSVIVERAWRAINGVFGDLVIHNKNGILWKPLRRLMLLARKKREENMSATIDGARLDLGISAENMRPAPAGYPGNGPRSFDFSKSHPNISSVIDSNVYLPSSTQQYASTTTQGDNNMLSPQIMGMETLVTDNAQQQQFQQNQLDIQSPSWLMDCSTMADLEMDGIEGNFSWEGWDEMVRDFQFEAQDAGGDAQRGLSNGGVGNWW